MPEPTNVIPFYRNTRSGPTRIRYCTTSCEQTPLSQWPSWTNWSK
jgi:hypothetical protein